MQNITEPWQPFGAWSHEMTMSQKETRKADFVEGVLHLKLWSLGGFLSHLVFAFGCLVPRSGVEARITKDDNHATP
jgi:hypothetical protein